MCTALTQLSSIPNIRQLREAKRYFAMPQVKGGKLRDLSSLPQDMQGLDKMVKAHCNVKFYLSSSL